MGFHGQQHVSSAPILRLEIHVVAETSNLQQAGFTVSLSRVGASDATRSGDHYLSRNSRKGVCEVNAIRASFSVLLHSLALTVASPFRIGFAVEDGYGVYLLTGLRSHSMLVFGTAGVHPRTIPMTVCVTNHVQVEPSHIVTLNPFLLPSLRHVTSGLIVVPSRVTMASKIEMESLRVW